MHLYGIKLTVCYLAHRFISLWFVLLSLISREVHDSTTASTQSGRGLYSIDSELLTSIKPTVVVTQSLCRF